MKERKPNGYWNLEKCAEDAKGYSHKQEWEHANGSAYNKARQNKWLDICCSHMVDLRKPKHYWTLDKCKESALLYTSRSEWEKK